MRHSSLAASFFCTADVAFEQPAVVGEDGRHRHARHLVEVALQPPPAVAFTGADEDRQVVLVERFLRRDGFQGEALLDGGLAGGLVDHDRHADHLAQRALGEHRQDGQQCHHHADAADHPCPALGLLQHQGAVDFPGSVGVEWGGVGLRLCQARRRRAGRWSSRTALMIRSGQGR